MVNCKKCDAELTTVNWTQNCRKKHNYICYNCTKVYLRKYYQEHRDIIKQRSRKWQTDNPEQKLKKQRRYYDKNRLKIRKYNIERRAKYRTLVLMHYSQDTMKCARCGFTDRRALSIDHINGGGTQHRKKVHSSGYFNEMLVRQGYPEGYQILCMNCQFIKRSEEMTKFFI